MKRIMKKNNQKNISLDSFILFIWFQMAKVNDKCIGCGMCTTFPNTIFKVDGWVAVVLKQPETPEEIASYESAKAACPVQAIE